MQSNDMNKCTTSQQYTISPINIFSNIKYNPIRMLDILSLDTS